MAAAKTGAVDKKALWVGWTHDAMSRYVIPKEIDDNDDLIEDMVEVSTAYADDMLGEYEDRFGRGGTGPRRRKKDDDDEDDDEDEDDDGPESR